MVTFGSFWKFHRVVKCYNWASNDAVASLMNANMFELYLVVRFYTNVMNLYRRSHALLLPQAYVKSSTQVRMILRSNELKIKSDAIGV